MRTEAQKEMDKASGVTDVEFAFDKKTGKITQKGKINRDFDGETLEKNLPGYRQQVVDMQRQVDETNAKLGQIEGIEETDELKEFAELMSKAKLLANKKALQAQAEKRTSEMNFHRDNIAEQESLLKQWRDWKGGN